MSGDPDMCKTLPNWGGLHVELNNAQIRIEERDAKIERQADIITRLEASRTGLKKENQKLRERVQELEDDLDDLELSNNPDFIAAMTRIVNAIDNTDFDYSKVKTVNNIMDLLMNNGAGGGRRLCRIQKSKDGEYQPPPLYSELVDALELAVSILIGDIDTTNEAINEKIYLTFLNARRFTVTRGGDV